MAMLCCPQVCVTKLHGIHCATFTEPARLGDVKKRLPKKKRKRSIV
jgi:hypothetical protein